MVETTDYMCSCNSIRKNNEEKVEGCMYEGSLPQSSFLSNPTCVLPFVLRDLWVLRTGMFVSTNIDLWVIRTHILTNQSYVNCDWPVGAVCKGRHVHIACVKSYLA